MTGSHSEKSEYQPPLEKLISLHKAAKISGLSASYLRILVRGKRIWGQKIGRNWVTTEAAVREYLARKRKPGRPKKKKPDSSN